MNWLDQIDFCIKTYKRPVALDLLRESLDEFYPGAKITVNSDPCIAKGRNAMVDATDRPFLLFLDDDFEFSEQQAVPGFPMTVWHVFSRFKPWNPDLGISAGAVVDVTEAGNVMRNSGGNMRVENGVLYLDACERLEANWRGYVDVVPNFFIARREVFQTARFRWGIGAEHADFFMQLQGKWKVYQDRRWTILHHPFTPALPGYKEARWNVGENILAFMQHWDLYSIVVNGVVVHSRPMENAR